MSSLRYPLYAGLLLGGVRHDALEFSAAGLSLTLPVVEEAGLHHLRRGDEREVTLCVGGAGWQEEYDVVLRMASRGPAHVGFAFVLLPPPARRVLERYEASHRGTGAWSGEDAPNNVFADASGEPAPFAFARLVEPNKASRRFILSISEAVFALTRLRAQHRPGGETHTQEALPVRPNQRSRSEGGGDLSASTLLVYAAALLAVLFVCLLVMAG